MKTLFLVPLLTLSLLVTSVQAQPPTQSPHTALAQVLERMRAEKLTLQQAWDRKLLTGSLIVLALQDENVLDPGTGMWSFGSEVREFTQLLAKEFPKGLEPPVNLNLIGQHRVARYYMDRDDARGVGVFEDLLEEMPREGASLNTVYTLLSVLGEYYIKTKEYQKAAETPYKIKEFTQTPRGMAPPFLSAMVRAAVAKDEDGVKQLLQEVTSLNYGWATGWAYARLARVRFREGKLEEGRALLKTPFEGEATGEFRIIVNEALADSYFKTQEWKAARRHAEIVIAEYNSLPRPPEPQQELEGCVNAARSILRKIDQQEQATPAVK